MTIPTYFPRRFNPAQDFRRLPRMMHKAPDGIVRTQPRTGAKKVSKGLKKRRRRNASHANQ